MATNLALDDKLIDEARRIGHHKTKSAAVNTALREYVQRHRQRQILDLVGQIDYESDYDYQALRKIRRV